MKYRGEAAPIQKAQEETQSAPAQSRSMDPETQAQWDKWARSIARKEVNAATKIIYETMTESIFMVCDKLNARIKELEGEVETLKQRQPAPSQEWPLRSVQGGR